MLKNYYLIKMKYSDIKMFIHCNNCNSGVLEVGQTHAGILIWCDECNREVCYIDKTIVLDPSCECAECGDDFEDKEDLK